MEDALEKLQYELYYIKNMSLALDLVIMFHTVKTMISGAEHGQARPNRRSRRCRECRHESERDSARVQRVVADVDESVHQPGASSELQAILRGSGGVSHRSRGTRAVSRPVDSVDHGPHGPEFSRARHRAPERGAHRHGKACMGFRRRVGQARVDLRQHERRIPARHPRRRDARSVGDPRRSLRRTISSRTSRSFSGTFSNTPTARCR